MSLESLAQVQGPGSTNVSASFSETEFQKRFAQLQREQEAQARERDAQAGPLSVTSDGGTIVTKSGQVTKLSGAAQETLHVLRQRVKELESELKKTTKRLAATDESRNGAFEQARELAKKLAATQKDFARVMAEKNTAMQQERLALEEKHHSELAAAMGQAGGASQTGEDAAHTKHLMARVQELGKELEETVREHQVSRRRRRNANRPSRTTRLFADYLTRSRPFRVHTTLPGGEEAIGVRSGDRDAASHVRAAQSSKGGGGEGRGFRGPDERPFDRAKRSPAAPLCCRAA